MTPRSFWRKPSSCKGDSQSKQPQTALKVWRSSRLRDGIILDVMMPRMDGYETAKQIKKLEGHKTTPIVMVTASIERSVMTQGFRSGAVVFMNKPFTAKKFLTMIQTIIR